MRENLNTPDCIRTHSGIYFNVFSPKPEMVDIDDIAHALSNQCRWGGHSAKFYSVAQHCVGMLPHVEPKDRLSALLHDASEAYLVDVPRPIKKKLANYHEIEEKVMRAIAQRFEFEWPMEVAVVEADEAMLKYEWERLILDKGENLICFSPTEAKALFLKEFYALTGNRTNFINREITVL